VESRNASYGDAETPAAAPAGSVELRPRTLFIGHGPTAVAWYRCFQPALFLNADWIGVVGEPPHLQYATGLVGGKTQMPNFLDYEVVVIQQPKGKGWLKTVRGLRERGVKVIYEVDDYLHGIARMQDHDFNQAFTKEQLRRYELVMRSCDAMIVSTDFLYRKYRAFNKNVHVCRNGVDVARYRLTRPPRPTVNIGWAGGTGHVKAAIPWLREVPEVMRAHKNTCFVSIGQNFANALQAEFTPARAVSIPFTALEVYPAAMTMLDVALAPAGKGLFFRAKSDLRWLEAGALGIPTIADPSVYPDIEHGVTGFHAESPIEVRELLEELVEDESLRLEVGANVRDLVLEERSMQVAARRWAEVLEEVAGE
jgi:glycosyltransferase involved in cell wall biosynthesis